MVNQIAFSLRESMFLNGILTNADIWYCVTKSDIEELELVDRLLLRRILSLPISTCTEALYLESGCLDISTIVKGRRISYLHYLVNCDKSSMLYKFFKLSGISRYVVTGQGSVRKIWKILTFQTIWNILKENPKM